MQDPKTLKEKYKQNRKTYSRLFKKLKNLKSGELDQTFHDLHTEVFDQIDCLQCANCCRTTGPLLNNKDIDRLAKRLGLKAGAFIDKYLRIDEDQDYVFQSMPCPFLGEDNYCSVYEDRPKACREYPHTDRKKMHQILDLTKRNCAVCPAVYEIVEKLK